MEKKFGAVKIDKETYDKLVKLNKETDIPMIKLVKRAVVLLETTYEKK